MTSNEHHLAAVKAKYGPFRVVIIYAVFSTLWILFSDMAVGMLFHNPELITLLSTLKGWLFVLVTSLLLYLLVSRLVDEVSLHHAREKAALEESKRTSLLLEAIVESSGDAIFAKDREGRYLLFNREAARVTGQPTEQVVGKDDRALFPPEQAELVRGNDRRVMAENRIITYEEDLRMVDGERVYLATKGPLYDASGTVVGMFGISRDITERKRTENALREREANFRRFFENNSSVMLIVEPVSGTIVDANVEATEYYGYSREKLLELSINDINILSPEQVALQRQRALHGESKMFYFQHRLASGEIRDVEVHVTPIETAGQPLLLSIIYDITDRLRVEKALRESEERLRLALAASNQGWFDLDVRTGRVSVSPEYVRMIGYDPETFEANLSTWISHIHPADRDAVTAALNQCMEDGTPHTAEYRRQTRDGTWRWIRSMGKIVQWDAFRKPVRMIGIHTDITERKLMEKQVQQLAFYDALTGLPNRRLLNNRLSQAMASSKRSGRYCALLFIDLDNFKPLNDTHGHEAGDLLLVEVAERMRGCVREMDTVARFGGDEFVVMICEVERENEKESIAQVGVVAEKIRAVLARPYRLAVEREGGQTVKVEHHCSASIGVALFINHELDAGEILRRADLAMYQAKEAGRNTIRFYGQSAG